MSSQPTEDVWDFTSVIDLNRSLSFKQAALTYDTSSSPSSDALLTPTTDDVDFEGTGELGNFDKIWEFLGQPSNIPPPTIPPLPEHILSPTIGAASDPAGTVFELSGGKGVRWRDEVGQAGIADGAEIVADESAPQLSKARKKKLRAKKTAGYTHVRKEDSSALNTSSSDKESGLDTRDATSIQTRSSIIQALIHGTMPETGNAQSKAGSATNVINTGLGLAKSAVTAHRYPLRSTFKSREPLLDDLALKRKRLIATLIDRFMNDRLYLGRLSVVSFTENVLVSSDVGLHVFVDASNILIGFHDALKISRGISIARRIRRQPISFHNLSIVLERGRPTAKRVLVGSDNFPAIQEAKLLGYETNILDRVHKAKELTPRQRKYHNVNGATSSGSETTAAMYAPEKWVEQAVDEILHLKILESVVDAEKPSTIVLATGDAAEAEYSQGFLKMVERALAKGWKVELCSFRKNISGSYRKKEFRAKWASRFKIIEMDDFVEELLGIE